MHREDYFLLESLHGSRRVEAKLDRVFREPQTWESISVVTRRGVKRKHARRNPSVPRVACRAVPTWATCVSCIHKFHQQFLDRLRYFGIWLKIINVSCCDHSEGSRTHCLKRDNKLFWGHFARGPGNSSTKTFQEGQITQNVFELLFQNRLDKQKTTRSNSRRPTVSDDIRPPPPCGIG